MILKSTCSCRQDSKNLSNMRCTGICSLATMQKRQAGRGSHANSKAVDLSALGSSRPKGAMYHLPIAGDQLFLTSCKSKRRPRSSRPKQRGFSLLREYGRRIEIGVIETEMTQHCNSMPPLTYNAFITINLPGNKAQALSQQEAPV